MMPRLKRNQMTVLLQMLLALCTLASCINDDFIDGSGLPDSGETRYLAINLKFDSDASTRAGEEPEFEDGTDQEHAIAWTAGNVVILFNSDNSIFGIYDLSSKDQEPEDDDYIEAKYSYVAKISSNGDIDLPKTMSCLVVLNASPKIYEELKSCKTLDDILNKVWEDKNNPKDIGYADQSHRFFTMTNSVYYDDTDKEIHVAEKFRPADHIYKTIAGAKRNPITVYVERMVAKFSLTKEIKGGAEDYAEPEADDDGNTIYKIKNNSTITYCTFDDEGEPTYKEIEYRIRLTGWGINALETESYLFKKIKNTPYLKGWNEFYASDHEHNHYRSYWSEDPHYDVDANQKQIKYLWQYRLAVNNPLDYYKEKYDENTPKNTGNHLRNFSFTDLNVQDFSDDRVVYAPENTYAPTDYDKTTDFDGRTNLLAGTHLIVGAELLVDIQGNGKFEAKDLYRDRKGIYYSSEQECFWALVREFNYSLQSERLMRFDYYDWDVTKGDATITSNMPL